MQGAQTKEKAGECLHSGRGKGGEQQAPWMSNSNSAFEGGERDGEKREGEEGRGGQVSAPDGSTPGPTPRPRPRGKHGEPR